MAKAKPFVKEDLLRAIRHTKSIRAAARYLGCSYQHLWPFMKSYRVDDNDPNSPTLFELHKNQTGVGIPKFLPNRRKEPNVKAILEGEDGWQSFTPEKIKIRAVEEGYLKECCDMCDFTERRVTDYKMPLLMHFRNGNKVDYRLENLQLLCYNCYYLYVGEVLTGNQIRSIESNQETKQIDFDWQLDEDQIANMKALGLWEDDEPEENSLIARNK
jgi:hypothetical protein